MIITHFIDQFIRRLIVAINDQLFMMISFILQIFVDDPFPEIVGIFI